jgi:hypothetical protein
MIPELRRRFNQEFSADKYAGLRSRLDEKSGTEVQFRISETPVFVPASLLDQMALEGEALARYLISAPDYLAAARKAIPAAYCVANETAHPNFLTADFALVRDQTGDRAQLKPKLVEIQAFPSVFGFQALLCATYNETFGFPSLGYFLDGLNETGYWQLLSSTILGGHDPENVVLSEIDPLSQKTLPDFNVTSRRLGIAVVDIARFEAIGDKLHYRNGAGKLVPIHRIYNRAIADELIARDTKLSIDLTHPWDVEWAGHPNWYFLISKFSVPWLSRAGFETVPPAVLLDDFLEGKGRAQLSSAGVSLPNGTGADIEYNELLLKPLFSFAGKGIQFEPKQAQLLAIPAGQRRDFLLQERMRFEPTVDTPHGMTQAEFRILYLWPDDGKLTPVLSLVRLGRGKMMGVDHNRNQEWVGASAAFFPQEGNTRE